MNDLNAILGPMRPPFLILPLACVALGAGTAYWTGGEINILHLILAFIGALTAHISVNALNEYEDFKSGLDLKTQKTPFSGGSGSLPARPDKAKTALFTGWITFVITALIGFYFVSVWGWGLLPLGIVGLLIVFAYTIWITRSPVLCLIAPGLGFGPLMVMGTDFVLTGNYSWTAFFASLIPFFLVSNLLLLNQYPDVEADQSIGRKHFPILVGRQNSTVIYGIFLVATFLSLALGVYLQYLPIYSLIGLAALFLAVPTFIGVYRHAENIKKLMPYMGLNVVLNIITPLLVSVGLFLG